MKGTAIAIIVGVVVLIILVALGFAAYYYFAIRCVADKEGGTSCTRDCECKDLKKCALESGDVNAQMVCCSVGTTTANGKNYCTGLPNGKACLTAAMCTSGVCTNGICSVPQGPTGPTGSTGSTGPTPFPNPNPAPPNPNPPVPTPAAPGGINTTCTADAMCAAGLFCGRFYPSLTAPLVCCPTATGQSLLGFGNFCGNVPDDLPCIESDPQLCAAGVCKIVFRDGNASVVCGAP